jgi:hypothetical protein
MLVLKTSSKTASAAAPKGWPAITRAVFQYQMGVAH